MRQRSGIQTQVACSWFLLLSDERNSNYKKRAKLTALPVTRRLAADNVPSYLEVGITTLICISSGDYDEETEPIVMRDRARWPSNVRYMTEGSA